MYTICDDKLVCHIRPTWPTSPLAYICTEPALYETVLTMKNNLKHHHLNELLGGNMLMHLAVSFKLSTNTWKKLYAHATTNSWFLHSSHDATHNHWTPATNNLRALSKQVTGHVLKDTYKHVISCILFSKE